MNIAIITPRFTVGGAQTYIISKSDQLTKLGNKVIVISEGGEMLRDLPCSVQHYMVDDLYQNPYYLKKTQINKIETELSRILVENKIDIIEAHNFSPIIYAATSYPKHKIPYIYNNLSEFAFDKSYQQRYVAKVLSKHNCFAVLNKGQLEYIREKCGKNITAHIIPIPALIPKVEEDLDRTDKRPYLLSVCRLAGDKMYLKYAIQGFYEYRIRSKADDGIQVMHVVGDGPMREEIEAIAKRINERLHYEAVVTLGSLTGNKLACEYNNCSAFVGVGTALLIAAYYKKPIIFSSCFNGFEQFAWGYWGCNLPLDKDYLDGCSKYLDSKIDYCEAIRNISDNYSLREKTSIAAYNLFSSEYDIPVIIDKWMGVYKAIVSIKDTSFYYSLGYVLRHWNNVLRLLYIIKTKLR